MIEVKNIAPGPRGLHTKDGPFMLGVGQTANLDMTAEEIKSSKATGWFVFEGQSAKEVDKAYDAMDDEELRALLADKGIAADGRWGHDKLVAEVKKTLKDDK